MRRKNTLAIGLFCALAVIACNLFPISRLMAGPLPPAPPETRTGTVKTAAVPPEKAQPGQAYTRQILLQMNSGKDGKVSKQEFMTFMEKQFDLLDQKKEGKIDVKELRKQPVVAPVGK